jgi:hypothetical protein
MSNAPLWLFMEMSRPASFMSELRSEPSDSSELRSRRFCTRVRTRSSLPNTAVIKALCARRAASAVGVPSALVSPVEPMAFKNAAMKGRLLAARRLPLASGE